MATEADLILNTLTHYIATEEELILKLLKLYKAVKLASYKYRISKSHDEQIYYEIKILDLKRKLGHDVADERKLIMEKRHKSLPIAEKDRKVLEQLEKVIEEIEEKLFQIHMQKEEKEQNVRERRRSI